ncbi:MAG: tol-pal system-associated acyl-CoA thioesterase [Halioglobus sp.]|jgi:tol-pal system-associated acyl-CoA thioesterase
MTAFSAEGEFCLPLRVYIEDTDAGGIVYYVNYLKFMERSRTELMRSLGFDKNFIFNEALMFVVRDVAVTYFKPATLDDELTATAIISRVKGATITMQQSIRMGEDVMAQGQVTLACVDKVGVTPRRLPKSMLEKLRSASVLS